MIILLNVVCGIGIIISIIGFVTIQNVIAREVGDDLSVEIRKIGKETNTPKIYNNIADKTHVTSTSSKNTQNFAQSTKRTNKAILEEKLKRVLKNNIDISTIFDTDVSSKDIEIVEQLLENMDMKEIATNKELRQGFKEIFIDGNMYKINFNIPENKASVNNVELFNEQEDTKKKEDFFSKSSFEKFYDR